MKKLLLAALFSLSATAMAADGSSGCGPAWYILKDNSLVSSVLRVTTNGILSPVVTIGMTMGTSNCTKHSIVQNEKKSLHFIATNFYEVQKESAIGSGEFMAAFSQVIGCKDTTQKYFNQKLKENYSKIFSGAISAKKSLLEVYKVILTDDKLTQSCSLS